MWFLHTLLWILDSLGVGPSMSNMPWIAPYWGIYFVPVGMVATLFLRGFPRLLLVAAWVLTFVFMGHFYIA